MIKNYISVCLLLIITSVFAQAQVNKISKTLEAKTAGGDIIIGDVVYFHNVHLSSYKCIACPYTFQRTP